MASSGNSPRDTHRKGRWTAMDLLDEIHGLWLDNAENVEAAFGLN